MSATPMKLPRLAAAGGLRSRGSIAPSTYEIEACTTNLGATRSSAGDPELPHCLVHVRGDDGRRRSLSIGRSGLGPERNADVPSSRCEGSQRVTAAEARRFERALQRCAAEGYAWGERDCCSCVERAFVEGLGRPAPPAIRSAAAALAAVPDPWASDTDP